MPASAAAPSGHLLAAARASATRGEHPEVGEQVVLPAACGSQASRRGTAGLGGGQHLSAGPSRRPGRELLASAVWSFASDRRRRQALRRCSPYGWPRPVNVERELDAQSRRHKAGANGVGVPVPRPRASAWALEPGCPVPQKRAEPLAVGAAEKRPPHRGLGSAAAARPCPLFSSITYPLYKKGSSRLRKRAARAGNRAGYLSFASGSFCRSILSVCQSAPSSRIPAQCASLGAIGKSELIHVGRLYVGAGFNAVKRSGSAGVVEDVGADGGTDSPST